MGDRAGEYLDWYLSGTDKQLSTNVNNCQWELMVLNEVADLLKGNDLSKKYQAMLTEKFASLRMRLGR